MDNCKVCANRQNNRMRRAQRGSLKFSERQRRAGRGACNDRDENLIAIDKRIRGAVCITFLGAGVTVSGSRSGAL